MLRVVPLCLVRSWWAACPAKSIGGRTAGGTSGTISGCEVESAGSEKCSMLAGSH